jgi:putative ABC transport system ATP-binding protein
MLQLNGIGKTFAGPQGPVAAVRNLDLSLKPGDFVGIQGESGSGKSTLLLIAGGLLRPDTGTVKVGESDVYGLDERRRGLLRAASIGFVFQQFHLIPYLSVLDNIMVPALSAGRTQALGRALELAARFQLAGRTMHVPAKLSVGEQQRTALARALINKPSLILADEPTGNLDAENAAMVLKSLAEFSASGGSVLLVTHDDRAAGYARRWLRMDAGVLSAA